CSEQSHLARTVAYLHTPACGCALLFRRSGRLHELKNLLREGRFQIEHLARFARFAHLQIGCGQFICELNARLKFYLVWCGLCLLIRCFQLSSETCRVTFSL